MKHLTFIFCCLSGQLEFIDSSHQVVSSVTIGDQVWMDKNMDTVTEGSWCYENNRDHCARYGRLYTWKAAMKVCPPGWWLPSDEDWKKLERFIGISEVDINKSGKRGNGEVESLKTGGKTGFEVLYGGYFLDKDEKFHREDTAAAFWTSSVEGGGVWHRDIDRRSPYLWRSLVGKNTGLSCRCIKAD